MCVLYVVFSMEGIIPFCFKFTFFFVYFLFVCFFGICDLSKGRKRGKKRKREARDFRVPFGHMGHRRRQETLVKKSLEWSDFFFLSLLSTPRHGLLCGQEHVCQIMGHTLILCKSWMGR